MSNRSIECRRHVELEATLRLALEALENNKQTHYYCEDTWYSCPQHEEGCANDSVGDECNCGADKANAGIDKTITAIKEALAQPEQEMVSYERFMSVEKELADMTAEFMRVAKQLAQPEQEPVAKAWDEGYRQGVQDERTSEANIGIAGFGAKVEPARQNPYGTTPPQRKPLTDEQLIDLWPSLIMHQHTYAFARAIEAAHGIKGDA